jgi:hypothetical protein
LWLSFESPEAPAASPVQAENLIFHGGHREPRRRVAGHDDVYGDVRTAIDPRSIRRRS